MNQPPIAIIDLRQGTRGGKLAGLIEIKEAIADGAYVQSTLLIITRTHNSKRGHQ
jgi:hypothetical protein